MSFQGHNNRRSPSANDEAGSSSGTRGPISVNPRAAATSSPNIVLELPAQNVHGVQNTAGHGQQEGSSSQQSGNAGGMREEENIIITPQPGLPSLDVVRAALQNAPVPTTPDDDATALAEADSFFRQYLLSSSSSSSSDEEDEDIKAVRRADIRRQVVAAYQPCIPATYRTDDIRSNNEVAERSMDW
ncbi:OLC1v1021381C1 [Oldenlandia corymbosa var. corymbosa]|uniref:OLC1v1021381C1 n=1 Tax=Oldenlandia corymbosa var. corymbosa TaxID=529605 RepID=A0AAV1BZ48_OLDCO|nr:OLC1v1021381C1 [Oldenlandia corymbosa var. corymbosa]